MKANSLREIYRTTFGFVCFFFSDCDCVDRFDTYDEMKAYAKENYARAYQGVRFMGWIYNGYHNCWEAWNDGIEVKKNTPKKVMRAYIEQTIQEMKECDITFTNKF